MSLRQQFLLLLRQHLLSLFEEQLSDEDIQKIQEVYRSIREGYIEKIDKERRFQKGALKGIIVCHPEDPIQSILTRKNRLPSIMP